MVEVKFTGKCVGCPAFDANIEKFYSDDICIETVLICANQDLCDHLEKHLKEEFTNGKEEG